MGARGSALRCQLRIVTNWLAIWAPRCRTGSRCTRPNEGYMENDSATHMRPFVAIALMCGRLQLGEVPGSY